MPTPSTLSKKSSTENSIYIKGSFKKEALSEFGTNTGMNRCENKKAVVRGIFQNQVAKENQRSETMYIIREGDYKRVNRDGVLRVYNINKPVDIPLRELLGKLEKEHTGVALSYAGGKWSVGGKPVENKIYKQEIGLLVAFRRFIKSAMAN